MSYTSAELLQIFNVIATESFLQSFTITLYFSVNHVQVMIFDLEVNGCVASKIVGHFFLMIIWKMDSDHVL